MNSIKETGLMWQSNLYMHVCLCVRVCISYGKFFQSEDIGDVTYCNLCDGRITFSIEPLKLKSSFVSLLRNLNDRKTVFLKKYLSNLITEANQSDHPLS